MINILGINISTLNKKEALAKIEEFLNNGKRHYIVTPNPEIILEARTNEEFFYILNKADLAIPDGVGLKFASWFFGKNLKRITGADLLQDILKIAEEKGFRAGIINNKNGLSSREDIEKAIKNRYSGLDFEVFDIELDKLKAQSANLKATVQSLKLEEKKFDIILAGLGAPYQEKFIYHFLQKKLKIENCKLKIAVGVGGAFDFLTGRMKRAPFLIRFLGFEWLWRLVKQPKRIKRIYNATLVFPFRFLVWRFIQPWFYRPNVACMLYKKVARQTSEVCKLADLRGLRDYYILIAERRDEKGHWQLVQGGTDGENLWKAGARELSEEIACDKFEPKAVFKNLWKYGFEEETELIGAKRMSQKGGYKGQKQGLFVAEFTGRDKDITINFWDHRGWKWVRADKLVEEVHELRKKPSKVFLDKFREFIK